MTRYTVQEINAAIEQGRTVTAEAADLERNGQPRRGTRVRLTQAFAGSSIGEIRATAQQARGRFRVAHVVIEGDEGAEV